MKFFIIAGEASGDLHGANLAKALLQQNSKIELQGWGGDKMQAAGVAIAKHYKDLALMGFVEVITKLPAIYKNFKAATQQIMTFQPDAVVLIDFSGFNLRLAKRLRKAGFTGKIFYYISPKLWVWNEGRVKSFKQYIDHVYCILPFEVDFYAKHNYDKATYIGNPLVDELEAFTPNSHFIDENQLTEKPIVALLPGSRPNEVNKVLPTMLKVVNQFPNYQFVIAGVDSMKKEIDEHLSKAELEIPVVYNQTYDLVVNAKAAIVTSGTATLEVALLNTPLVLVYNANAVSYFIAKNLVNIDFIGLPNLIMEKEMIKELIQNDFTTEKLANELALLLGDENHRNAFFSNQKQLQAKVGKEGASKRAAKHMINEINQYK